MAHGQNRQEGTLNEEQVGDTQWSLWVLAALAVAGKTELPGDGDAAADACVEQFNGGHPWIACRATFEPDAQSREAILQMTLGTVRNASCGADVRLERKGLVGTYLVGGVLELEPHEVSAICRSRPSCCRASRLWLRPR